jgi:hypothetical protein
MEDSVLLIRSENLDLSALAERYRETAGYYYNPADCKKKLGYLIAELDAQGIDSSPLKEMSKQWNP